MDNISIIQDALTKAQATCEASDEQGIKNALNIVNKASDELGTSQNVPSLAASDGSDSSSTDTTSENETDNQADIESKKKRLRKKKNKKKSGDASLQIFIKTMEEQTKQIKRLADNKATEIEDIGRGNRTETSFNASTMEAGQEQGSNPVIANPPPFITTTSGPPPPFGGQGHQQQETTNYGGQAGYRPKVCKKLAKGLCTFGLSGFINGERCPEPHPKPC